MKLNAGLQILVLPLKANTKDGYVADPGAASHGSSVTDVPFEGPFLPERLAESESSMVLGEVKLLATAIHTVAGSKEELRFGHSQGTLESWPDEELWTGRTSACISLWWTNHGMVLTLERVATLIEHHKSFDVGSGEPFAGVDGLQNAIYRILEGTGLNPDSPMKELLGGAECLVESTSLKPVSSLCIESSQSYRNTKLIEGLFVRVEPNATKQVEALITPIEDFDRIDAEQSIAIPWKWSAVELVIDPAEPGARIAIREDGRSMLLNEEAMSPGHDYDGPGGCHLVVACLPEIARLGALAENCSTVAGILSAGSSRSSTATRDELRILERSLEKTEAFQRRQAVASFERGFIVTEKFKQWTHGGQLVPILWTCTGDRANQLDQELRTMTSMVTKMIDNDIQSTTLRIKALEEERANRRIVLVTYESAAIGIGALALLVGLFMTTAMAPAWSGVPGLVNMWPSSFWVVGGTVFAGFFLGLLLRRIRKATPSK